MIRHLLSLTIVLSLLGTARAQDLHFSQFYNMPVWLNPALTGVTEGDYRIAAIYRNQWWAPGENFGSPAFMTPGLSIDAPIRVGNNALGIGGLVIADRQAGGALQDIHAALSISYVQTLGSAGRHRLSVGLQGTYMNRRFDADGLQFASQFTGNTYNASLPGETFEADAFHSADVHAGLAWSSRFSDRFAWQIGTAVSNIARVDRSYLAQGDRDDDLRFTAHTSMDWALNTTGSVSLLPSVLFLHMAGTNQMNSGLGLGIDLTESTRLTVGPYLRSNGWVSELALDAIIGYVAVDVKGLRIAGSYDHTISDLQDAAGAQGSMEVSVVWVGRSKPLPEGPRHIFCPRF